MDYLLISGEPNSGKTRAIKELTEKFTKNGWREVIPKQELSYGADFRYVLKKNGKTIVIHSPSERNDFKTCKKLCDKYEAILLISACRETNFRDGLFNTFSITKGTEFHKAVEYHLVKISDFKKFTKRKITEHYAKIDKDICLLLKNIFKIVLNK